MIGPKSSGGGSADFESESDFDEILEEPGSGKEFCATFCFTFTLDLFVLSL